MKTSLALFACLIASSVALLAGAPQPASDLQQTLTSASQEKKMSFILLGRATCSICNATRAMIKEGKIPVTATNYVMADLNIDDQKTRAGFMAKYGNEKFGNTLPFVVVTDSQGALLASSGGYKDIDQWKSLLRGAKAKATKTSGDAAGGTDSNWPFKSAAPAR
jgi:thioredoxin-related protein